MRHRFDSTIRTLVFALAVTTASAWSSSTSAQAPATQPVTCGVAGCWCMTPGATAAVAPAGDPYGFLGWLNATRARYGLAPVGYDPNLASWAAANNAQQQARGLGHFVMGPASRQNAAMGSAGSIGMMWLNSPAHRAAMLDPGVRWMGLAGLGAYWTLNLR